MASHNSQRQSDGSADSKAGSRPSTAQLAGRLIRNPMVLGHVLFTARRAQIITLVAVLIMLFVVPPVLKTVYRAVGPKKQTSELFGLVKKEKPHPVGRAIFGLFYIGAWAGALGISARSFWRYIPTGAESAHLKSVRLESKGDEVRSRDASKARHFYYRAVALECDPEREESLRQKLFRHTATMSSGADATMVESKPTDSTKSTTPTGDDPTHIDNRRYEIKSRLGEGAMGVVYRATDTRLQRMVAIKELPARMLDDETSIVRFKQEATAMARLSHPNILQVYDLIDDNSSLYMILEYVEGGDLDEYIEKRSSIDLTVGVRIIAAIADGLAAAHEHGIVHRDLKPKNILLTSHLIPKVADFGIARLTGSTRVTQDGSTIGSPSYMSPEQIQGEPIDHRCDLYALGLTAYELLTGRLPFTGDLKSILSQHVMKEPPPPSEFNDAISPQLNRLILEMLTKDPEQRTENASIVSNALRTTGITA